MSASSYFAAHIRNLAKPDGVQTLSGSICFIALLLSFFGCATPQKKNWYEFPGIALGGATIGAVIGPENVAIMESDSRRKFTEEEAITYYVFGSLCHLGTVITLGIVAPPVAWAYMGLSSIVGGAQFSHRNAWDDGDEFGRAVSW